MGTVATLMIRNKRNGKTRVVNEREWSLDLGRGKYSGWERVGHETHGTEDAPAAEIATAAEVAAEEDRKAAEEKAAQEAEADEARKREEDTARDDDETEGTDETGATGTEDDDA